MQRACRGVLHSKRSCRRSFFALVVKGGAVIRAGHAPIGNEIGFYCSNPSVVMYMMTQSHTSTNLHSQDQRGKMLWQNRKNKMIHVECTSLKQPLRVPVPSMPVTILTSECSLHDPTQHSCRCVCGMFTMYHLLHQTHHPPTTRNFLARALRNTYLVHGQWL